MRTLSKCTFVAALILPVAAHAQFYQQPYPAPALPQMPAMPGPTVMNAIPMGGGMTSYSGMVNGQPMNGTSMPMGGGMTSSTVTDGRGHPTNCTTIPMGGGMASTTCY